MFEDKKISELDEFFTIPSNTNFYAITNNDNTNKISLQNSQKLNYRIISTNYVLVNGDQIVFGNASAGNITITLPAPSISNAGRIFYFKKTDVSANTVILNSGGFLIDSVANYTITKQNDCIAIYSDGTNYKILNKLSSTVSNIFDLIIFNNSYIADGNEPSGSIYWNSTEGTLETVLAGGNVNAVLGEQLYARVRNAEATTLQPGEVVYLFGASGNRATVKRASNAGDPTSSKTLGIVAETIAANQIGFVITQGVIGKMNLGSPYVDGDVLWLGSTPGTFTRTKPTQPNHLVFIGVVERANAGNGQIYVKPQNGYELNEIHDVLITNVINGQTITWDSSSNLWKNTATNFFETVNKNLKSYPAAFTYNGSGDITNIFYTVPGGNIIKSFNYTNGNLTSIVLSGNTPAGVLLTKTFNYTNDNLTGVTYS